jgi:hypothetical protein
VSSRGQLGSWLIDVQVTPFEPHLIPFFVFGRCLVLYPESLRPSHVVLGVVSYLLYLVQARRGQGQVTDNSMPISTRVISHQKEERGLPGGLAPPVVVCKLCEREVLCPVILLMVDEEPEIRLYPLVISFRLSVCSRMIGGGDVLLYGEQATQFLCEPGCEPRISVAYYFGG